MQWAQGVPRDLSTTIAFEITGLSTQLYLQRYVEVKPIRGKQTKKGLESSSFNELFCSTEQTRSQGDEELCE